MDKLILEQNKMIAEYITDEPEVLKQDLKRDGTLQSLHYHDDYLHLMPAIKKIEYNTGFELIMCSNFAYWSKPKEQPKEGYHGASRLEAAYNAVVAIVKTLK